MFPPFFSMECHARQTLEREAIPKVRIKSFGFTLTELIVAIAIAAILLSLAVNTGFKAISNARTSECAQHLRQIGVATIAYAQDNGSRLPLGMYYDGQGGYFSWDKEITPYLIGSSYADQDRMCIGKYIACPADTAPHIQYTNPSRSSRSYAMIRANNRGVAVAVTGGPAKPVGPKLAAILSPSKTFMFSEFPAVISRGDDSDNVVGGTAYSVVDGPNNQLQTTYRRDLHVGRFNYLYIDGHVEFLNPNDTIGKGSPSLPGGAWTIDPKD